MAEYDVSALADQAVEDAMALLPPLDQLMKLSTHNFLKAIILAAAPTIEEGCRRWLIEELAEVGMLVDPALIDGTGCGSMKAEGDSLA